MPGLSSPESPLAKKRPASDAFAELMSPKTKRAKTKPVINAFEEMMQSASKPDAFCPVSNESIMEYLEENPYFRQILGEFIFMERQVSDSEKKPAAIPQEETEEPDHEEDNSVVRENMYRLYGGYLSYDSDPDTYGDCLEHRRLAQVWQVEKLRESVPNSNLQIHTNAELPPPPSNPSSDAALIGIRVHFADKPDKSCIKGFTMIYDDDTEIPVGQLDGTKVAEIVLNKGEQIVGVKVHHKSGRFKYMDRIGFKKSSENRWLIAFKGAIISGLDDPSVDFPQTGINRHLQKRVPQGRVLRSIEFDPESLPPMFDIVTVPSDEMTATNEEMVSRQDIRSLQSLIKDQTVGRFKARAASTSQSVLKLLAASKEDVETDLYMHNKRLRSKLQRSPEAAFIRFLDRLRDKTAQQLDRMSSRLQRENELHRVKLNADFQKLKTDSKARCQQEQLETYKDHLEFHDLNARLSAKHNDIDADGSNERLCIFPDCRRTFCPGKLPLARRCVVGGCASAFQTCGCLHNICDICHKSVCPWHADEHAKSCLESAPRNVAIRTVVVFTICILWCRAAANVRIAHCLSVIIAKQKAARDVERIVHGAMHSGAKHVWISLSLQICHAACIATFMKVASGPSSQAVKVILSSRIRNRGRL